MKWSVKIFFDRELHRMHLRKSSLQNSSALVQTLFLQKSMEKSLLIPMRSIKSAQYYISRTISRRQKFFCKNRPIFGMIRDAEVRGGEEMHPLKNIEAERARAGMTRKELAQLAGVSERTLRRWLLSNHNQLIAAGYQASQRKLPPRVVKYLMEFYGIER